MKRDGMTYRARAYLAAVGLRHGGIAYYCIAAPPNSLRGTTVELLAAFWPFRAWGVALAVIAAMTLISVATRSIPLARGALIASATVSGWWGAALVVATFVDGIAVMPLAVTWIALTTKDLVVSGMPLETPLENAARARGLIK